MLRRSPPAAALAVFALLWGVACSNDATDVQKSFTQHDTGEPRQAVATQTERGNETEVSARDGQGSPIRQSAQQSESEDKLSELLAIAQRVRSNPRRAFSDCDQLSAYTSSMERALEAGQLDWAEEEEETEESPYLLTTGAGIMSPTGTNLRVAGVDEPDHVKVVGDYIYDTAPTDVTEAGRIVWTTGVDLRIVKATPGSPPQTLADIEFPRPTGVRLGSNFEALIEDTVAIFFASHRYASYLYEYDITDPARPQFVKLLEVSGAHVRSVRLVAGKAVVILESHMMLPLRTGRDSPLYLAERYPSYRVLDHTLQSVADGMLVDCQGVHLPLSDRFPFNGTVVMSIDLNEGLTAQKSIMVLNRPRDIYVSGPSVYIGVHGRAGYELHRVSLRSDQHPRYAGSVLVDGRLDEWLMDEYDGRLRLYTLGNYGSGVANRLRVVRLGDWWADHSRKTVDDWEIAGVDVDGGGWRAAFFGDRVYIVQPGRGLAQWKEYEFRESESPTWIRDFIVPGGAIHVQPLGDDGVLILGMAGDLYEGGRSVLVAHRRDSSGAVRSTQLELGSERMPAVYEYRRMTIHNGVAWPLKFKGGGAVVLCGVEVTEDQVTLGPRIFAGQEFLYLVPRDDRMLLVTRAGVSLLSEEWRYVE